MTRLDTWLWSVRLFKTRSAATTAVRGGHVRCNDVPAKPAHQIKAGDVITVHQPGWDRVYEVVQVIEKRVGAPLAQACYLDRSAPKPAHLSAPIARRDRGTGRPTKKQRREIERLRGY